MLSLILSISEGDKVAYMPAIAVIIGLGYIDVLCLLCALGYVRAYVSAVLGGCLLYVYMCMYMYISFLLPFFCLLTRFWLSDDSLYIRG